MVVVVIVFLGYMNWCGVGKILVYLLVGLVLWVCILKFGVYVILVGVIVGFMILLYI